MRLQSTRLLKARETFLKGLERVKNTPTPEGQKYAIGTRVQISENSPTWLQFPDGRIATVEYTYAHAFGGNDVNLYSLDLNGRSVAWFHDYELIPID